MFAVEERARVRERLVELARADPEVAGAAHVGSYAADGGDRWSDIDLHLGIEADDLAPAMERWTRWLYDDFGALHHWDLPSGAALYRVFLLRGCLEVDLGFRPITDFGPRGPDWRTIFGEALAPREAPRPTFDHLVGLAWHHLLHAHVSIERGRWWQAVHWIGEARNQVFSLACRRLGLLTGFAKAVHLLPREVAAPLAATLPAELAAPELRRALRALIAEFRAEVLRAEPDLVERVRPLLSELDLGFQSC
jgi:hypothetical protein